MFTFLRVLLLACFVQLAFAGEPPTEPILRFDLGEHTATINRIASDADGRYLVTASDNKTARVWDLRDGRLLSTLRIPIGAGNEGKLYAVALSPDGNTVALGGWTGYEWDQVNYIYLFDRASGRMIRKIGGLPTPIGHLDWSRDGKYLAATLCSSRQKKQQWGIVVWDAKNWQEIGRDLSYQGHSYSVSFNRDGTRLITTSDDGYWLYAFNGNTLNLLSKQSAPGGRQPYAARFSPDDKQIAVGFGDSPAVNVLNAADLSFAYAPDTTGVDANLGRVAWTAQGLVAAGKAQKPFGTESLFYLRHWQGRRVFDTALAHGTVRTNGFVNDLASAENGAVVFTASSGSQLSQENSAWGNGAFTKSVVEGLLGKADPYSSGFVTAKGLDFYVDGRVRNLTNNQQTPVSIAPNGLIDFRIVGVGR